jgi:hypothetical protein
MDALSAAEALRSRAAATAEAQEAEGAARLLDQHLFLQARAPRRCCRAAALPKEWPSGGAVPPGLC